MAITLRIKKIQLDGYGNTHFRYAITYVVITFVVLLLLNIYCSEISQQLFNRSKETAMIEKCLLAADEIAALELVNTATVTEMAEAMDSLKVTRMIVTDQYGMALYDSSGVAQGSYVLLPEILDAMNGPGGFDTFSWKYSAGTTHSRAAAPILSYGSIIGCVYMTEYDTTHGALIRSLEITVLQITVFLELIVVLFSLIYASSFSHRIRKIMHSMRIIQNGDYSHKLELGGNDELTILGREFNDLTDRLHASEQKRRRFVSDASHELKTPLASIKLLTDSILQNEMDTETLHEFVEDIGSEAERLNRMTAKLLLMTKMDVLPSTESEIIYMAPTIRRVVRMLAPMAKEADVHLRLELENDCPVLILEDDLYQIVFNLIENGIKYNCAGGTLTITLSRDTDNAYLTVCDTGVGIPADAVTHIFERFYRVDKARSRASGGSGLGLAIVKAIVQRNRGEIRVDSEQGKGTTFTVTLPAFDTEVDRE